MLKKVNILSYGINKIKKNFLKNYAFTPFQVQKKNYLCLVTFVNNKIKNKNNFVGG